MTQNGSFYKIVYSNVKYDLPAPAVFAQTFILLFYFIYE